jgi:hypothetical protein
VGVAVWGTTVAKFATPLPNPPPQGGRGQTEFAAVLSDMPTSSMPRNAVLYQFQHSMMMFEI